MGERSLVECVQAELDVLNNAIASNPACGATLQAWYEDGAMIGELVAGLDTDTDRNDALYAWGYLNGAADRDDVTVLEYVESLGLSFDHWKTAPCARVMKCLCAGHARGNPPGAPCDTSETPIAYRGSATHAMFGPVPAPAPRATPKKPRRKKASR